MNATVMAIILVLIVVATVVTKKVPFNFVLFIVPIICSLLLGFSLQETSDFVLEQFSSIMKSAGFMLLFAFLYFQMLTEAGVFGVLPYPLHQGTEDAHTHRQGWRGQKPYRFGDALHSWRQHEHHKYPKNRKQPFQPSRSGKQAADGGR